MFWPSIHRRLRCYWHPAYRPPFSGLEVRGLDPRRADLALWYLVDAGIVRPEDVVRADPVELRLLARVHSDAYLESLLERETLARIFAVDPSEVQPDSLLESIRRMCGATVLAAREALRTRRAVLNLGGGFHHAGPKRGGGFCAVNDIAVAVADLRAEGLSSRIAVLDLDAHPPDGTAECLAGDGNVWIGSLSAADWGALPGVNERVLPERCEDEAYLEKLEGLLQEMPSVEMAFVIAGNDVLAADALGRLGLTLEGARRRDAMVHRRLAGVPSVWMPGGGYSADAWKVLAGTAMVLSGRRRHVIPAEVDPLSLRFRWLAEQLDPIVSRNDTELSMDDVEHDLHMRADTTPRLLETFTPQAVELLLYEFGVLGYLERLGFSRFEVQLDRTEVGEHARLFAWAQGRRHLLIDTVLSRRRSGDSPVLYVNWLTLRNPIAGFGPKHPSLPGQEVPGLGLSREMSELFLRMSERLGLIGVAFCPSTFHVAFVARDRYRFVSPERQGRFEALLRDLRQVSLLEATQAIAEGRVLLNGQPYSWEPTEMRFERDAPPPTDADRVAATRDASHFTLSPRTHRPQSEQSA